MKKAVIAALSICCLMGVVTASAAEVQVKTEKTVSAAVDAADELRKKGRRRNNMFRQRVENTMKVR